MYDIYYPEALKSEATRGPSSIKAECRVPTVERASSGSRPFDKFSPVPLRPKGYGTESTTSAPGFEHLHTPDDDHDMDWIHDASFFPMHMRTTMDKHGHMSIVAVPIGAQGLTEDDLLLEEIDSGDGDMEDEDSNNEDYYGNEYPDQDEWDAQSDSSIDF